MIIYAYLLLASIAISTVNAECMDIEPFTFQGNDNTMCAGSNCGKNKVKTNCPLTCGECTPVATDCADTEPFKFQGDNVMCADANCSKNKVLANCPLTCGECTPDSSGTGGGDSGTDCADTEPFTFQGNANTMCADADCSKNKVLANCPLKCGECTPDSSGTGGGDSGGGDSGGGDSGGGVSCEDAPKSFKVDGENGKKKCKKWESLCGKDNKVNEKCPKTCGRCGPPTAPPTTPCVDVSGKFKFGNNGKKNCKQIGKKKNKHCGKSDAIVNCPMTCGLCKTERPTSSPSDIPSAKPTSSPSDVPSSAPTPTPSNTPTASPTMKVCTLKGTITIPGMGDATYGYHSASLRVSKGNWDVVCSSKKRKTGWGCVHEGEAKIGSWSDDQYGCKEDEAATIEYAAGGTYSFTMEHTFHDKELYYADDHLVRPELTVTVNGIETDTLLPYRYPRNKNTDTHDSDGLVNGAYEGIVIANVECDADCDCRSVRVLPECPIRAEIRFPTMQDAEIENIGGYHNDAISVSQDGVEDSCSSSDPDHKWCVHEGDGFFYSGDDDYYNVQTESIVIPEGKGGKYLFEISHDFETEEQDEYYGKGDDGLAGEVHIWISNKKRPVFTHWLNGNYEDTFYLDVECDDECKCGITQKKYPVCKIDVKLKFPNRENMDYYGYKNDYVIAEKGGETEICQWENQKEKTNWNCLHDMGDAYVYWDKKGLFEKDVENLTINNAADGNFRLTLQHWPSPLELYYENDYKIASTMSVSINDDEPGKFSHPQQHEIDTHLEDGTSNPDYPGTLYVDVMCDSRCICDVTERLPTCQLKAELSFPEFADDYYGYNAEVVSASRKGYDDECGFYSPMTEWGCFSSGDAFVIGYTEESESNGYYDINSSQLLNIPDASDGEFLITVQFYSAELNPYYEYADKFRSMLNITVNDEEKGSFKHKLNTDEDMYNGDGTLNEDYTSEIYVTVICDENCECEAKRLK